MSISTELDIGPLSWVKDEINLALGKAETFLADPEQIKQAVVNVHQARGALAVVGLPGVTEFTEALEQMLKGVEQGRVPNTIPLQNAAKNAIGALRLYLDTLVAGSPNQPLRLFGPYQALFDVQGLPLPAASDLFFPDLSLRPPKRERQTMLNTPQAIEARREAARYGFDRGLERFLNGEPSGMRHLRNSIAIIELGLDDPRQRTFWWATLALMDAVAAAAIPNDENLHKLLGRIASQIRKLLNGSNTVAERLLRDVLYWVAVANTTSGQIAQVRGMYRLDELVPQNRPDAEEEHRRQIKLHAIEEEIPAIEDHWDRFCGGSAAALVPFHERTTRLAELAKDVGQEDLARLAGAVSKVANAFRKNPLDYHDGFAIEVATALLLIESAVGNSNANAFGGDFVHQVDVLTKRLTALVAKRPLDGLETPQLDALTREAREKRMMGQVSKEILTNLADVEQVLDGFFRNPASRDTLGGLKGPLRQVYGALLMLGEAEAASLVQECQKDIDVLATGAGESEQEAFTSLAHRLSALGMYVEQRRFGAASLSKLLAPPTVASEDATVTVEDQLAEQAQITRDMADALSEQPGDDSLRQELKESLETLKEQAHLTDDTHIVEQASAALEAIESSSSSAHLSEVVAGIAPITPIEAPVVSQETAELAAASEETLDAEMLAIFIEEAQEVMTTLATELPHLTANPEDREALTVIRRSFHTLKGSSRMVGLHAFGEAAWGVEQVLNRCLKLEGAVSDDVVQLLGEAVALFTPWVEQLAAGGSPHRDAEALADHCDRLLKADLAATEAPVAVPEQAAPVELEAADASSAETPVFLDLPDVPADATGESGISPQPEADTDTPLPEPDADILLPDLELPVDEEVVADAEVDVPETSAIAAPSAEAADKVEIAPVLDALDLALVSPEVEPEDTPSVIEAPTAALEAATFEAEKLPLPLPEPESEREPAEESETGSEALSEVALKVAHETAAETEEPSASPDEAEESEEGTPDVVMVGELAMSPTLHSLYVEEARGHLTTLEREQFLVRLQPPRPEMIRAAHTLASASATTGVEGAFALAQALEKSLGHFAAAGSAFTDSAIEPVNTAISLLRDMVESVAALSMPEPRPEVAAALASLEPVTEAPVTSAAPVIAEPEGERRHARIEDELDEQLLPLFLEESEDLMPAVGAALRAWRESPAADTHNLQRLLHTLKGSARMAGAMVIGELVHAMESRVIDAGSGGGTAEVLDDLESSNDRLSALIDHLRNPTAAAAEAEPEPAVEDDAEDKDGDGESLQLPGEAPEPLALNLVEAEAALRAQLRVRADLVDRLVNEAGEMAISRSRVEGELRGLKGSLLELTENVMRLRGQLREIEIQAESQIESRQAEAQAHNESFDPLEMDRFTRFQELTRMMAESVNDVATVQQNLLRNLDQANGALNAQARINRDMSTELMGVRMTPFHSIADRLHRVVRQSAKDLGRRANLDIRGGQTEMDRSVLEAMLAPIEHLLRNCVAHGLEDREVRTAAGKPEQGEIALSVTQQGNEVLLEIIDDGAGLNLERIRSVAIERGLINSDQVTDDRQLAQIIFQTGFSTAREVTAVAGRGVGLDVVRNEVASLGGRIDVDSRPGLGTTFRIHLPVTLALSQAVLVKVGDRTYAIPSSMVEQASELKPPAVEKIREDGAGEWQGKSYPWHYLNHLLGQKDARPLEQRRHWVIFVRSGSQRVLVEVDDLLGGEEIVVKNIGPQLSRVAGISGATVLGDGEIVLILNPVALAERQPGTVRMSFAADMGQGTPDGDTPPPAPAAPPTQPMIMVVDDSLTVRKITGRLLERAGYQVTTAKDGVDALEKLIDTIPDVVLADIEMPRMDGFDLVRNMRNDPRLKGLPVIMITSRTAEKHRAYAREIGVDHYLGKPYDEEQLLGLIADFLAKS